MNEEKAVITDLSEVRKQKENQAYLKFAEFIVKQIDEGKTKEDILHMILKINGGLKADPREMQYFSDLVDIVFRWHYKNKGKEFQTPIRELLDQMIDNQKYLYKGKDGKKYATRADLNAADENYKNQMYRKNPKNM